MRHFKGNCRSKAGANTTEVGSIPEGERGGCITAGALPMATNPATAKPKMEAIRRQCASDFGSELGTEGKLPLLSILTNYSDES